MDVTFLLGEGRSRPRTQSATDLTLSMSSWGTFSPLSMYSPAFPTLGSTSITQVHVTCIKAPLGAACASDGEAAVAEVSELGEGGGGVDGISPGSKGICG